MKASTQEVRDAINAKLQALGEDRAPRVMAQEILDNPEQHTPAEIWISLNYLTAMDLIDIVQATAELKAVAKELGIDA